MSEPATPSEGLGVLHLFCKVGPLADADAVRAAVGTAESSGDQVVAVAILGHKADLAFMVLGLMFIGTGGAWCLLVAVFAARAARRVRQSGKGLVWINRALGGVFIYLGIRVALLEAK